MTFGSLFAGIGGIDLGLERAGMRCMWQVEIDPYAQKVLEKHWPKVTRWQDIKTFPPLRSRLQWKVDLISGGFPCQDLSLAGNRKGLEGERSGLFFELMRVVRVLRPKFVLLENVPGLLVGPNWMGSVLKELALCGFDAEWQSLPASGLGLPHYRNRVFLVAYPQGLLGDRRFRVFDEHNRFGAISERDYRKRAKANRWDFSAAPKFSRMDDRVFQKLDRLKCIGNAVVPQVAEWIGRSILSAVK